MGSWWATSGEGDSRDVFKDSRDAVAELVSHTYHRTQGKPWATRLECDHILVPRRYRIFSTEDNVELTDMFNPRGVK